MGNNIVLVIYGIAMAEILSPIFGLWIKSALIINLLQTIAATIIVLFTGEFLPKTIFRVNPNLWLQVFAPLLWLCYVLLFPIAHFATFLSIGILRLLRVKIRPKEKKNTLGIVDLDYWINDAYEHADNQEEVKNEVTIFQNALDFSSVKLRDCIVPRTESLGRRGSRTSPRKPFPLKEKGSTFHRSKRARNDANVGLFARDE